MKNGYNLYNLSEIFKKWLFAEKNLKGKRLSKATLKNYLSDLKHFLGWSILKLKAQNKKVKKTSFLPFFHKNERVIDIEKLSIQEVVKLFDANFIEEYKKYLFLNHIPVKTINRRLSTLRKFFSFCIDQGWISLNPAKKVKNIKNQNLNFENEKQRLLEEFKNYLFTKKNLSKTEIPVILEDVNEFLKSSLFKSL